MNDSEKDKPLTLQSTSQSLRAGRQSQRIHRAIYEADSPEQFVKALPAQTLYFVLKNVGVESSAQLIEMASLEQGKLLLDFDCWEGDNFNEENFWKWLEVADEENNDLHALQKVLSFVDLKLVSRLLAKYADVQVNDDNPTEMPPGPKYYTPDKGYTWITINIEDPHRHFQFARFLALVFETSRELFYQLLSIPAVATMTQLEEESYQDRSKRLAAEAIPDRDFAASLHAPLNDAQLEALLKSSSAPAVVHDIMPILPLIYDSQTLKPLEALLRELATVEAAQAELTLIANSAMVHWNVPYYEVEEVQRVILSIKGALNMALEFLLQRTQLSSREIYNQLGFQTLYRWGIGQLLVLRHTARKLSDEDDTGATRDAPLLQVLYGLRQDLPQMPNFIASDGSLVSEDGKLKEGFKPIEHLEEILALKKLVQEK